MSENHYPRNLIQLFLEMLSIERGASRHTLTAYRSDLSAWEAWTARRKKSMTSATSADVRAFLAAVSAQGFSAATRARRASALRQFSLFLSEEGFRNDDPTQDLHVSGFQHATPIIMSAQETSQLLNVARERAEASSALLPEKRYEAVRLWALLETAYAAGLRVSELVSLPFEAVDPERHFFSVIGKRSKERIVVLSETAQKALRLYYEVLKEAWRPYPPRYLFPSRGKPPYLARQVFARELKRLASAAGLVSERVTPHTLRHACASHLLHNGVDLRTLQRMLGHESVVTTQIYTHTLDERKRAMVRDLHPLAQEEGGE